MRLYFLAYYQMGASDEAFGQPKVYLPPNLVLVPSPEQRRPQRRQVYLDAAPDHSCLFHWRINKNSGEKLSLQLCSNVDIFRGKHK